jgi:hypothetical protein
MDMKALLVPLCAPLVVTHNAEAVRVPDPDPEQGDGRVSAFYTWGNEIRGSRISCRRTTTWTPGWRTALRSSPPIIRVSARLARTRTRWSVRRHTVCLIASGR